MIDGFGSPAAAAAARRAAQAAANAARPRPGMPGLGTGASGQIAARPRPNPVVRPRPPGVYNGGPGMPGLGTGASGQVGVNYVSPVNPAPPVYSPSSYNGGPGFPGLGTGASGQIGVGSNPWADIGLDAALGGAMGAANAPYIPPVRTSGSGRTTSDAASSGPAVTGPIAAPATYTAPPAVQEAPAVMAAANPSGVNVAGQSFTSVGNPSTFGGYERRRLARGPRTGLSVTPEMIRRAATQRIG